MRLPTQLSRHKADVHKNTFGHVLVIAGSRRMLGASALCSLTALRSGAGLVTSCVPKSLNAALHKKISNCVMTWPLAETKEGSFAFSAITEIKKAFKKHDVIALGPGISQNKSTQKLVLEIIAKSPIPIVIDADGLNALAKRKSVLTKSDSIKIITPHPGEMARLTGQSTKEIEQNRRKAAVSFARKYKCIVLLKGHKTVVAAPNGKTYNNQSGNAGMATAGSGDVLTGMIAAFIAQGLSGFEAAKYGAFLHGRAGNLAAKSKTKLSMIASDLIDFIPRTIKS